MAVQQLDVEWYEGHLVATPFCCVWIELGVKELVSMFRSLGDSKNFSCLHRTVVQERLVQVTTVGTPQHNMSAGTLYTALHLVGADALRHLVISRTVCILYAGSIQLSQAHRSNMTKLLASETL